MVSFFKSKSNEIYAVNASTKLNDNELEKLVWLFSNAEYLNSKKIQKKYIGPRKTMVTPWSTNAVEITQNMGFSNITRIEKFKPFNEGFSFDKMTNELYNELDQSLFKIDIKPETVKEIINIEDYNQKEGLALSNEEVKYLENLSKKNK